MADMFNMLWLVAYLLLLSGIVVMGGDDDFRLR
jgi:hypothetical protein